MMSPVILQLLVPHGVSVCYLVTPRNMFCHAVATVGQLTDSQPTLPRFRTIELALLNHVCILLGAWGGPVFIENEMVNESLTP